MTGSRQSPDQQLLKVQCTWNTHTPLTMSTQEVPTSDTSPSSSVGITPSFTPIQGSKRSPGLQIPEPTDGYFGYVEEKSLRHVRR